MCSGLLLWCVSRNPVAEGEIPGGDVQEASTEPPAFICSLYNPLSRSYAEAWQHSLEDLTWQCKGLLPSTRKRKTWVPGPSLVARERGMGGHSLTRHARVLSGMQRRLVPNFSITAMAHFHNIVKATLLTLVLWFVSLLYQRQLTSFC